MIKHRFDPIALDCGVVCAHGIHHKRGLVLATVVLQGGIGAHP